MGFLLLIIIAQLTWIIIHIRKSDKLKWTKDTLHPVYSKAEIREVWGEMKEASDESLSYGSKHSEEIGAIADKLKKNRSYKLNSTEETLLKNNFKIALRHQQLNDVYYKMIETNIGVMNGSIKKHIYDVEELDHWDAGWVNDNDIEKEYKGWIERVSK